MQCISEFNEMFNEMTADVLEVYIGGNNNINSNNMYQTLSCNEVPNHWLFTNCLMF